MADALNLPEPKLWTLGAPGGGKVLTGIKPTGTAIPVFTAGQVADAILAERERCAAEAEHWQQISGPQHKCGEYIAAAIRATGGVQPMHGGKP